jgi:dsDNA-binding SOS-regulon protein
MEKGESEKLEMYLSKQKSVINELLKTIRLPISRHLSKEMLENAKVKELRIK